MANYWCRGCGVKGQAATAVVAYDRLQARCQCTPHDPEWHVSNTKTPPHGLDLDRAGTQELET